MDLRSGYKFEAERSQSSALNKLWFQFNGFTSIQEYAYACYDAIYGKVPKYNRGQYNMLPGFTDPIWSIVNDEASYNDRREKFLLIQNVFYGLIYNMGFLSASDRQKVSAHLSEHDFHKSCVESKDIKKAFFEFLKVEHPFEEWLLRVDAKFADDDFIKSMFYGCIASLLWRTIHNEVNMINARPDIEVSAGNIGDALDLLIGRVKSLTSFDGINKLNERYISNFYAYKEELLKVVSEYEQVNYDPVAEAFENNRGKNTGRLFLADLLFCLRKRIGASYVADMDKSIEERVALKKGQYQVPVESCKRALRNGAKVAHHLSVLLETSKRKVDENIEPYIIDRMADKLVENTTHDYCFDAAGGLAGLLLLNQGAFYVYWTGEVSSTSD